MTSTSLYCDYVRADDRPPAPSLERLAFTWNRKPLANVASDAFLVRVRARQMAEDHSQNCGRASCSRPPRRTAAMRRANPLASSVSTASAHNVASPIAGSKRAPEILVRNRVSGSSLAIPSTGYYIAAL